MKRRTALTAAAMLPIAGCSSVEQITSQLPEPQPTGTIRSWEWQSDQQRTLEVTFATEHEADFLALVHEADSAVLSETDAPRFDGPVSLPVWQPIACSSVDWPSRTFELVAGTGTVDFGAVDEILEREPLELSEEWMADAEAASPSTAECV